MLASFVRCHRPRLETLAHAWLTAGAGEFGVWQGEQPLARWAGSPAEPGQAWLIQPLAAGEECGELRLLMTANEATRSRLAFDAQVLEHLLAQEADLDDLTGELIETQDQLLALYDLARATRHRLDLPQALQSLAAAACRLIKCAFAAVILLPDGGAPLVGSHGEVAPGVGNEWAAIIGRKAQAHGGELSLAYKHSPCERCADLPAAVKSLFITPMVVSEGWDGILMLVNKVDGDFTSPNQKLARAIAEQAGGQIENLLLYRETLAQARLETEMELARSVQMRLLPQRLPQAPGLDVCASSRPALRVGGDFYDFVERPDSPLIFTIGDVAGKGAPAALLMAMTHAIFRSASGGLTPVSPGEVLMHLSTHLYQDLTEVGAFVTTFVGQYDAGSRRLVYANAGHSPVIYYHSGCACLLEADAPAIGVLPVSLSQNQNLSLAPGDLLVIATDGFNEAANDGGAMFGLERLLRLTENLASAPAAEIAAALYDEVSAFSNGHPQDDDQTLLVVKGVAT